MLRKFVSKQLVALPLTTQNYPQRGKSAPTHRVSWPLFKYGPEIHPDFQSLKSCGSHRLLAGWIKAPQRYSQRRSLIRRQEIREEERQLSHVNMAIPTVAPPPR